MTSRSRWHLANRWTSQLHRQRLDWEDRSYERIRPEDLRRLAAIARDDQDARFNRRARWRPYADRVLCVALCQGAAPLRRRTQRSQGLRRLHVLRGAPDWHLSVSLADRGRFRVIALRSVSR